MATGGGRDPGWGYALRHAWLDLLLPFPQLWLWRAARKGLDSLTTLRALYVVGIEVVALITLLLWVIQGDPSGEASIEPEVFLAALVVVGLGELLLIHHLFHKPLEAATPEKLAEAYRARTIVGWSLSLALFLIGFVGSFVTNEWTMVFAGIAAAAAGTWMTAPTRARLAAAQNDLTAQGSSLDLADALVSTPFSTARRRST